MNESGQFDQSSILVRERENIAQQAGYVEDAERVIESCVKSAGIDHVRHCKLANAPETLKYRGFKDIGLVSRQPDESVDWITYSSFLAHTLKHFPLATFDSIHDFE